MRKYTYIPREYTRGMALEFAAGPTENLVFARQHEEFGERYCGNIEARLIDTAFPSVSIGSNTAPWDRGRGLQTRALTLLLGHGFAHGIQRVEVKAAVHNSVSLRVAEAAGCHFERIMLHGENLGGQRQDLAVYAAKLSTD